MLGLRPQFATFPWHCVDYAACLGYTVGVDIVVECGVERVVEQLEAPKDEEERDCAPHIMGKCLYC